MGIHFVASPLGIPLYTTAPPPRGRPNKLCCLHCFLLLCPAYGTSSGGVYLRAALKLLADRGFLDTGLVHLENFITFCQNGMDRWTLPVSFGVCVCIVVCVIVY